jgi:hypothetical protein
MGSVRLQSRTFTDLRIRDLRTKGAILSQLFLKAFVAVVLEVSHFVAAVLEGSVIFKLVVTLIYWS